ncbi:MAG: LrgB family protein [bacterium]|uniref:LrgB family protein n=1 Tax=Candidatus Aphodosoma intestinipullorum TaxID=2840674 RepID=A0A940DIM4_9BACT|nr:LrgB family protein [Candidatus Aphodosoma intestinipullorum]
MAFLNNPFFLLALTFVLFFFSRLLQKKTGVMLLNPILITITLLIIFLEICGIDYSTYQQAGQYIEFWLKPAIVALGIPLYLQLESIKRQLLPIMLSQLAGCVVGVVSVVLIAKAMGASQPIILSLAAKSVTTPIAMEVTKAIGGIPSLTAAVVVCVGLFGGIIGVKVMRLFRISRPQSQGLSLGAASHAVGTDTAMKISEVHGAYASLGLIINGLFTSLLTPFVLHWCGIV